MYLNYFSFISSCSRGHCSFCCYWWNCWPSLFKLSFHNQNLITF